MKKFNSDRNNKLFRSKIASNFLSMLIFEAKIFFKILVNYLELTLAGLTQPANEFEQKVEASGNLNAFQISFWTDEDLKLKYFVKFRNFSLNN